MLFTTAKFLGFFLVAFSVYWLLGRHRWRLVWLTAASAFFYACWRWEVLFLILGATSVDYLVALRLQHTKDPRARKALVLFSVAINLSILGDFKYAAFLLDSATDVPHWPWWSVS